MSILLPLYMYPWEGVWNPLYWAAGNNTHVNFTVILNPCSGPCTASLPEQAYLNEMPKLKNYPNIRTLGYVATNYTNRPIDDVLLEIYTYANWTDILGVEVDVDGIFFDETPGTYDWRWHDYLTIAKDEVKALEGLGERVVVHNPGTIPYVEWNYLDIADITVVFEETFAKFIDAPTFYALKSLEETYNLPKSAFAIMMHSIPNVPDEMVEWIAVQMKEMTQWGFISSVVEAGEWWHSFSKVFEPFVWEIGRARG